METHEAGLKIAVVGGGVAGIVGGRSKCAGLLFWAARGGCAGWTPPEQAALAVRFTSRRQVYFPFADGI